MATWPGLFEAYFTANFGGKRELVQLHNWLGYRLIGDLQSDAVLVGRDNWLFLKQNFGWEAMRAEHRLEAADVRAWEHSLTGARELLSQRNVPLLFVLVPNKDTIYPQFLPRGVVRVQDRSRADEVVTILTRCDVDHLDLRAPIRAAAQGVQVYDSIDSHWNGYGARIGAQLLMSRVAAILSRSAEYAALNSRLSSRMSWADIPLILSLDGIVTERSIELVPERPRARRVEPRPEVLEPTRKQQTRMVFEVNDPSLPKALILRDSFAEGFMPTINEKFRRTVWLWTHELDLRHIEREDPDIVIVEMAERFLSDAPPKLLKPRRRR